MKLEFLETLRKLELEKALCLIKNNKPDSSSLLEIGAGTGWQAKQLSEAGYSVEAIDVKDSNYARDRIWKVEEYDGKHIPFPDSSFDVVFSSNVLEHIPHIIEFQKEIHRVLKTDGIAVHILPSGNWRFWTNFTYYPFGIKLIANALFSVLSSGKHGQTSSKKTYSGENGTDQPLGMKRIVTGILPKRHGEIGTAISELYYFSKKRWSRLFKDTGWEIKQYATNGLFYTGHTIFNYSIPIRVRERLSRLAGSSCHIFLLAKAKDNNMV